MSNCDEGIVLTASEVCLPTHEDDSILGEDNPPSSCAEQTEPKNDAGPTTENANDDKTGKENSENDNKPKPQKKKRVYYDGCRLHVLASDEELDPDSLTLSCRRDSDSDIEDNFAHINAQTYTKEIINRIIGVEDDGDGTVEIATREDLIREAAERRRKAASLEEASTKAKENSESETKAPATSEGKEDGGSDTRASATSEGKEDGGSNTRAPATPEGKEDGGSDTRASATSEGKEDGGSDTRASVTSEGKENSGSDTRVSVTSEASTKSKTPKKKKRKVDLWFKKKRKRPRKEAKPRGRDDECGSGSTSPSVSDSSTRKSQGKSPDSSGNHNRDSTIPSPCPAEYSDSGAVPDSTVAAAEGTPQFICHCNREPHIFMSARKFTTELYCQALDSMNNRIIGCCNTVPSQNVPMFRASQRTCFQMLCTIHRQRLNRHNSCPVCGLYCTKGRFYMCRSMHHFHKVCVPPNDDGLVICPHCGDDTPPKSVIIIMTAPQEPILLPRQRPPRTVKAAKIGITRGVAQILEDDKDLIFQFPPSLLPLVQARRNPSGSELSDGDMLAHLLSIAYRSLPELPSNCNTRRCSYKTMHAALLDGDIAKVLRLLAAGLNPNHQFEDDKNRNALHVAAHLGHASMVHVLLQAHAQLDTLDSEQNTALTLAIIGRHNDIVKYLIKAGADLYIKSEDGMTPLHVAAKCGNVGACFHILSSPSLPFNYMDTPDDGGWTPLVWASEFNHLEVVRFLLSKGADPLVKDTEQNIALHWAAFGGSIDIVELFLNDGIDINIVNVHGDTPLHIAARQDKYKCVLLLLARGAKSCMKNLAGEFARDCSESPDCEIYRAITLNMEIHLLLGRFSRRTPRIMSNDITRGKERNQIQCVNGLDHQLWPSDFVYVTQSCFTSRITVDRIITNMKYCVCTDACNALTCGCGNVTIKYDTNGRLLHDFNYSDPPIIFECNEACYCNRITCRNRVVQNGVTCRFQLFKTQRKGWGIKTLNPIPKGSFVCEYIGEIITDSEADHREDDSYLFDLDNKDGETYCIDARHYGNFARFINHMCVPNLMPVHVFTDHQDLRFPRIAFFSSRDIAVGEELGYNYGEKFWIIKCKSFTCKCGSEKCMYSDEAIEETLENYNRKLEEEGTA